MLSPLNSLCAQRRGVVCAARTRFGGGLVIARFGCPTTGACADGDSIAAEAQRAKASTSRTTVLSLSPARLPASDAIIARPVDRVLAYIVDAALCAVGYVANSTLASVLGVGSGWGLAAFMPASILIFWYNGGATLGQLALGLRTRRVDNVGGLSSPSLLTASFYVPGRAFSPLYGLVDWPCMLLFARGECLHNYVTGTVVVDELNVGP